MSGSTSTLTGEAASAGRLHAVIRYSAGSAIIMMIAIGADYTLAYLTPMLALNFLAPGAKTPTLKSSAAFLFSIAAASFTGLIFSRFFLDYPLVFLPLLALIIFHVYYTTSLQNMKVWLIISLLVIPMMSIQSPKLGSLVAVNLFMNALIAILMVWFVYFLFPQREEEKPAIGKAVAATLSSRNRFTSALSKTLVVIPVLIMFFVFNLSDSLLVLIFIAVLSMNPAAANKKTGLAMILANLGGGIMAIMVFNLLTISASYLYFGILTLLTGLLFANKVFEKKPAAALFGMAFSTFLLILGNVISLAGEAGEKVWLRLFQIGIAMVYLIIAFGIVNRTTALKQINSEE
jgi:hypothetical protein